MVPEFLGRLPIIFTLQGLDEDMLVKILKEPRNAILKQYEKLLEMDEVKLEFEENALRAIAKKALEKDTGARALRAILEEYMLDIMYEIPKGRQHWRGDHHRRVYRTHRWSEDPSERTGAAVVAVKRIQMGFYIQGGMTYERRFIWKHQTDDHRDRRSCGKENRGIC